MSAIDTTPVPLATYRELARQIVGHLEGLEEALDRLDDAASAERDVHAHFEGVLREAAGGLLDTHVHCPDALLEDSIRFRALVDFVIAQNPDEAETVALLDQTLGEIDALPETDDDNV